MPDRRIAYVLKRFPRFSETFILNELLAHEAAGADVDVFSLLAPPEEPRHARLADLRAEVTVLKSVGKGRAGAPGAGDAALFSGKSVMEIGALQAKAEAIAERAAGRGITHFHAHFGSDATTVACLAARIIGGTYSFTAHARDIYHTYVSPEADAAMRRAKLSEAAFVVTVSDYNARHLLTLCPEARVVRIYNGIDLSVFRPAPAEARVPGQLIAVGRIVPKKGFDVLLAACRILKDRSVPFDLSLIGTGPEEAALRARIARFALGGQVRLEGALPQETLAQRMACAEAAVLPCVVTESGDRDGLPTVLLEAMAQGLPVVTTTVSGGPEIVADGVTGRLCAPGDAVGLAEALQEVLADRARARAMGQAGRRRAEAQFDLGENAARLRALLMDPALAVREAA
ncbi:glycosyltransferase [Ovoidimarina sediminis]|uniref:glycosyltransferase n=1 Tax=Ovoidimarina sediminis TaxID=3079856 RepID=UPI0029128B1D|nr:glycosyltransferase [Rhodophyticola sp. MJ-SS7]MDU8943179.1 glycosyltransferase [Rhodophyticola sp. MJ-SS7]